MPSSGIAEDSDSVLTYIHIINKILKERKKGRKEERKKGRKEERKKGRKEERKKGRKEGRENERKKSTKAQPLMFLVDLSPFICHFTVISSRTDWVKH